MHRQTFFPLSRVGLLAASLGLAALTAHAQIAALPATFSVETVDGLPVPFQNGMPVPLFEKQTRATIDLKGIWFKQRFSSDNVVTMGPRDSAGYAALVADAAGRFLPSYTAPGWTAKNLPAVENTLYAMQTRPETYEDGVWYRRTFTLPDSLNGSMARLVFYAVNYVADVWLNGHYLGYHEGGYTSFAFDATAPLRFDTTNVLVVRVDNPSWGPTPTPRNDIVPYGTLQHKPDWFNYTGIIHDVYLEFSNRLSIARAEAVPQGTDGTLQTTVTLWNKSGAAKNAAVTLEVHEALVDSTTIQAERPADLLGPLVMSLSTTLTVPSDTARAWRATFKVPNPKLWSPKHPDLYILRVVASVDGKPVDELCSQFGLRTLGTTGNALLLNGRPMFFPGVARHEDHYLYGRSVPKSVIFSDLKRVVDLNATFLRTAHYPNNPYTYLVADRLGIAVLEEIPVWWFDEAIAWTKQDLLRHIHEQMWREMLFRDRNRPAILFWSTCNECLDQTDRQKFIQRLNTELDTQYPDGRFVTESAAADRPGPADPTQAACDVAGWTMYFGIFHGGTYYDGTRGFLAAAKVNYPLKPFLDTEFGYWSTEDLATAAMQVTTFDSTFMAFNEFVAVDSTGTWRRGNPLAATTWWAVFDWYTAQTGNQTMGLYKMDHATAKPVADRLRQVYRPFKLTSETATADAVANAPALPSAFALGQNYPNPFNPSTTITCQLPSTAKVTLTVYDLLGRNVAVLMDGVYPAGIYPVRWDASREPSGVYFYRLLAEGRSLSHPMILLK